jgi:hypothetical protein
MKRSINLGLMLALAGALAMPAHAQQDAAAAYREPLAHVVGQDGTASAPRMPGGTQSHDTLGVMPTQPTALARVSQDALGMAGKSAFALAAEKTGTHQVVPPPSYPPYRPNLTVPDAATTEPVNCQPNGALTSPGMCTGR